MTSTLYPWPEGVFENSTPAIVLIEPKYPHNVGQALRMAACFGARQVLYTGRRMESELRKMGRIPREERMRDYQKVGLSCIPIESIVNRFRRQVSLDQPVTVSVEVSPTPVCVEFNPMTSESLVEFVHPELPVYVFGPEDGSVPGAVRAECHRFLHIPTRHCLNLAGAVGIVLYDLICKRERDVVYDG